MQHRGQCSTLIGVALIVLFAPACSSSDNKDSMDETKGTEAFDERPPSDRAEAGIGGSEESIVPNGGADTVSDCQFMDDQDHDGDGYSYAEGDCNDCEPNINPGAFDVIGGVNGGPGVDEDCNGIIDDEPTDCDFEIGIAEEDPMAGARAIGLCRTASADAVGKDRAWGVLSARYVKADGSDGMNPLSHGVLPQFGAANVQQGGTMLALSSGTARAPDQPGYLPPIGGITIPNMGTQSDPPPGYPKATPACPGVEAPKIAYDPAALEVTIRAPTNAKSLSFNINFYTAEFAQYICRMYNDFYVTMMTPAPPGMPDGNISFDQVGNPISVNNSMLQVCQPQTAGGKDFTCPLGTDLLEDTGFVIPADAWAGEEPYYCAATGWLVTRAPVEPGSDITLRFAVWDSADYVRSSVVLIDNFQWSVETVESSGTKPVERPM